MKFDLSDFVQLDTKGLFAVNGGSPCAGSTSDPSSGSPDSSGGDPGSNGGSGNGPSSTPIDPFKYNYGGLYVKGGGGCSRPHTPPSSGDDTGNRDEPTGGTNNPTSDNPENNPDPETDTNSELPDKLVCTNLKEVHCDILAWNHAVDDGIDPRGENGTDWDANNKTVNQIFNEHFAGKDVAFDGNQAGKKGFIVYDWNGNGSYEHIEYGSISADGLSYSYYNNTGFESGESYLTKTFAQDSNAGAKPDSTGTVRFIPLN